MFEPVMATCSGEEVLKEDENQILWNPIVKHGGESQDKEGRDTGTAQYLSTKELLLENTEGDSERMRTAKRRAELNI